jgi:hypothetical protein
MTEGQSADRLYLTAACLLGLGFVAVALQGAAPHLSLVPPDTAHYAVVARNLLRGDGYTESVVPFHPGAFTSVRHVPEMHGLLRPIVLVPLLALLGTEPIVLRIPGLAYVALTGLVVFCWGRRVFGREAGLLACALTLLNVNLLWFALLGADDIGFAFFFTASLALLHAGMTGGTDRCFLAAGVLGALAMLEKLSGFILVAVFLTPVLFLRADTPRRIARRVALLLGPFAMALVVYLARNYVAYGSLQFRFGALNWIGRVEGHEGWSRVFERAPFLFETWRALGWSHVAAMAETELLRFASAVLRFQPLVTANAATTLMVPAFLPLLGLCGIPLFGRRIPRMTALFVAALLGSLGFICLFYTALIRYFSMLIPLFALWASGVLAAGARSQRPGRLGTFLRVGSTAAAGLILAMSAAAFVTAERAIASVPDVTACRSATAWMATGTRPGDRIMAFDPWFVAWATDREAIMIPSGGLDAIGTIARRYDAHWMLGQQVQIRPRTSHEVFGLAEDPGGLQVQTWFDDGACRVYRLDWAEPLAFGPSASATGSVETRTP